MRREGKARGKGRRKKWKMESAEYVFMAGVRERREGRRWQDDDVEGDDDDEEESSDAGIRAEQKTASLPRIPGQVAFSLPLFSFTLSSFTPLLQ